MKSLRNIGLAVVLSLGASQMNATGFGEYILNFCGFGSAPVIEVKAPAPIVPPVVVEAPQAITGFARVSQWGKNTFTKENGSKLLTSCKKYGKKGLDLVKNNKKTSIAIAVGLVTVGVLAKLAHKYSWLSKAKNAIFVKFAKKSVETNKMGSNVVIYEVDPTKKTGVDGSFNKAKGKAIVRRK